MAERTRVTPSPRSFACDLATLCAPTLAGLKPASLFRYQPAPGQDAADMAAAVEAVNTVAPEHLELHCKDAMGLLGGIRNAGAIFVGAWSSEPLGDYVAGPNHTLPTGGTAMFSNPLSVEEFVKRSSVICYTPEGLLSDAPATQRLAEAEGLWAHALSAALRRRVLEQGEDAVSAESLAAADLTKVAWPGDTTATVVEGVDLAAAGADGAGATGEEA